MSQIGSYNSFSNIAINAKLKAEDFEYYRPMLKKNIVSTIANNSNITPEIAEARFGGGIATFLATVVKNLSRPDSIKWFTIGGLTNAFFNFFKEDPEKDKRKFELQKEIDSNLQLTNPLLYSQKVNAQSLEGNSILTLARTKDKAAKSLERVVDNWILVVIAGIAIFIFYKYITKK